MGWIHFFYLSLCLPSSHKHLADLIVGGGPVGQPTAGLSCFAGQGAGEGDVPDDATSPDLKIASTASIFFSFSNKEKSDRKIGQKLPAFS